MAGWVHIKFKKPLIISGFGFTHGNSDEHLIKNFRFYGKIINQQLDLNPQDESSFGPIAGFTLLKAYAEDEN